MKRIAYLALPLLLCALVWGVKWRADHPTPTKLDLELRALMLKYPEGEASLTQNVNFAGKKTKLGRISATEFLPLATSLYVSDYSGLNYPTNVVMIRFTQQNLDKQKKYHKKDVWIFIDIKGKSGCIESGDQLQQNTFQLHPMSSKAWIDFIVNHPELSKKLRK